YGDQRVDIKGRQKRETVLANMERLIEAGIPFGAITVLARNTLPHARGIYRFFDTLGIRFRLLPFYLSASPSQIDLHALTFDEIVETFKLIFDDWLLSEKATAVYPVQDQIEAAVDVMTGAERPRYDKFADEVVLLVNTDGSTHGVADAYSPEYSYGNIFHEPMDKIMNSAGRVRAALEADARYQTYCGQCPYKTACPGSFVVDATAAERKLLAEAGCPLRSAITHILNRAEETGLKHLFKERACAAASKN